MMSFEHIPCPLCGSTAHRILGSPRKIDALISTQNVPEVFDARVVECTTCSLIYVKPFPRYSDQLLLKMYSNENNYFLELTPFMERIIHTINPARRFAAAQRLAKKKIEKFLEIGCGQGYGLQAARKFGWQVHGQDLSPDFAQAARERAGVDIVTGQLDENSFPGKKFDLIYIDSVLEHCADPVGYMKCIINYCAPQGIVYLVLPNEKSIPSLFMDGMLRLTGDRRTFRIAPFTEPYHLLGFSRASVCYLAHILNLEVISLVRRHSYYHRERYNRAVSPGRFLKKKLFGIISLFSDMADNGMNMEVVFSHGKPGT